MKIIFLSFAFLVAAVSAKATVAAYMWTTNADGTIAITGISSSGINLTIPSAINGRAVTVIADGAFQNNTSFLTISIPSSVTSIGASAFANCTSLQSLTLPAALANLGDNAFNGCGDLGGTIALPSTLTSLGETVFQGCFFISAYSVNASNPDYASSSGVLYNKSLTTLMAFPPFASATSFTIPNGVTSIADDAFFGSSKLVTVTNPASLTKIGDAAFVGCTALNGAYFLGNEPKADSDDFTGDPTTAYYYSSAKGWGSTFAGIRAVKVPPPSAILTVTTNGLGSITPVENGQSLVIGSSVTLTASPAKNWLFDHWAASGSENFTTNTPALKFTMESGLTLTAYFDTNNFLGAQGTYNGLFAPSGIRGQTNSGAVTFTVTSSGKVSGKLTIGTNVPSWSGQFDTAGFATIVIPRKGLTALTVTLQLNFADQSAAGEVTDGSFTATLWGDQQVFSAKNPARQYEGQYSLVIGSEKDALTGPFGSSFGTVSVSATGAVAFKGSLADGTTVSQNSFVSKDGRWPLYLPLYNGRGSLWYSNYLTGFFEGHASWINETNTSKTALYRLGFTNQSAQIDVTLYTPAQALPSTFTVYFAGGSLPFLLAVPINVSSSDKVTVTNASAETNKLAMTITKSTGAITGHFANPANPKEMIKFAGNVQQNPEPTIHGYFSQTNGTSGVVIGQTP